MLCIAQGRPHLVHGARRRSLLLLRLRRWHALRWHALGRWPHGSHPPMLLLLLRCQQLRVVLAWRRHAWYASWRAAQAAMQLLVLARRGQAWRGLAWGRHSRRGAAAIVLLRRLLLRGWHAVAAWGACGLALQVTMERKRGWREGTTRHQGTACSNLQHLMAAQQTGTENTASGCMHSSFYASGAAIEQSRGSGTHHGPHKALQGRAHRRLHLLRLLLHRRHAWRVAWGWSLVLRRLLELWALPLHPETPPAQRKRTAILMLIAIGDSTLISKALKPEPGAQHYRAVWSHFTGWLASHRVIAGSHSPAAVRLAAAGRHGARLPQAQLPPARPWLLPLRTWAGELCVPPGCTPRRPTPVHPLH
jgi:hypothetical protein